MPKLLVVIFIFFVSQFALASADIPDSVAFEKDPLLYNKRIVKYVEDHLGKKIHEGEIVDLPLGALVAAKAKQDFGSEKIFGHEVSLRRSNIEPGDIIQTSGAEFEDPETKMGWKFHDHSFIVYSVGKNNVLKFAIQNLNNDRMVKLEELGLNNLKRGSFKIYRAYPPDKIEAVEENSKETMPIPSAKSTEPSEPGAEKNTETK